MGRKKPPIITIPIDARNKYLLKTSNLTEEQALSLSRQLTMWWTDPNEKFLLLNLPGHVDLEFLKMDKPELIDFAEELRNYLGPDKREDFITHGQRQINLIRKSMDESQKRLNGE